MTFPLWAAILITLGASIFACLFMAAVYELKYPGLFLKNRVRLPDDD